MFIKASSRYDKPLLFYEDVKCNILYIPESYFIELGEYTQDLCCAQLPTIYT